MRFLLSPRTPKAELGRRRYGLFIQNWSVYSTYTGNSLRYPISGVLIHNLTLVLCTYLKIRFLGFQLESPKLYHRNSRYVLNNRDYSVFKQNHKLSEHSSPFECISESKGVGIWINLFQGNMFSYKSSLSKY